MLFVSIGTFPVGGGGLLDQMEIKLTSGSFSLAWAWVELGNNIQIYNRQQTADRTEKTMDGYKIYNRQ